MASVSEVGDDFRLYLPDECGNSHASSPQARCTTTLSCASTNVATTAISRNPLAWLGGDTVERVDARWRILTVHHLDGVKANCNWWNLVPLCQRDHLIVQRRVVMHRVWPWEHTDWFKPYVAAFYAFEYLGENLTRPETLDRLDELLAVGMEHARREPWQDRLPV